MVLRNRRLRMLSPHNSTADRKIEADNLYGIVEFATVESCSHEERADRVAGLCAAGFRYQPSYREQLVPAVGE